jgi:hypothetical protein
MKARQGRWRTAPVSAIEQRYRLHVVLLQTTIGPEISRSVTHAATQFADRQALPTSTATPAEAHPP